MKNKSMPTYVLASILAAAGVYNSAHAGETSGQIDDKTATAIIKSLATESQEDLDAILSAQSVDQLSEAQKEKLLKIVQSSAQKFSKGIAPLS